MRLPNSGAIFPSKSEDISSALEFSSRTVPPNRTGRELPMHYEGFLHEQLEDAGELMVPKMVLQEGRSSVFQHESSNSRKQPPTKQLGRPLRMLH